MNLVAGLAAQGGCCVWNLYSFPLTVLLLKLNPVRRKILQLFPAALANLSLVENWHARMYGIKTTERHFEAKKGLLSHSNLEKTKSLILIAVHLTRCRAMITSKYGDYAWVNVSAILQLKCPCLQVYFLKSVE